MAVHFTEADDCRLYKLIKHRKTLIQPTTREAKGLPSHFSFSPKTWLVGVASLFVFLLLKSQF